MARRGNSEKFQQKLIQPQDYQIQQNAPGFDAGFPSASGEKAEERKIS